MKKKLLLALALVGSLIAGEVDNDYNLLYDAPAWYPAADHYGSAIDTGDAFFSQGIVSVDFTLATKKVDDAWPYIELVCETGQPLTGTDSIIVSYKCDTTMSLKLYQTDLGSEGNESYALYHIELPSSEDWTTQTVGIVDFVQPEWADAESRAIDLNLDNVERIYLVPNLSAETGGESSIKVKYLSLIPHY